MATIRLSGSWMSIWDDRILEILSTEGPQTPTKISDRDYVHVGQSNISRRFSKLNDHGLVNPLGNGVYEITDQGRQYLDGNYDAEKEVFKNQSDSLDQEVYRPFSKSDDGQEESDKNKKGKTKTGE